MTRIKARTDITFNPPILFDEGRCDLCGCCVGVCPPNCIALFESRIEVAGEACIRCGFCLPACPLAAISWNEDDSAASDTGETRHDR